MEQELLQFILVFFAGLVCGVLLLLLWNKLSSGSASPSSVKQDYEDYQNKVEEHFEATSKKFQDMTEQYQDLYKHLSVGATSLCRPDSVAAGLADESKASLKLEDKTEAAQESTENEGASAADAEPSADKEPSANGEPSADKEPSINDETASEDSNAAEQARVEQAKKDAAQAKVDKALGEQTVKALKEAAQEKAATAGKASWFC